jgi:hypothetical protein
VQRICSGVRFPEEHIRMQDTSMHYGSFMRMTMTCATVENSAFRKITPADREFGICHFASACQVLCFLCGYCILLVFAHYLLSLLCIENLRLRFPFKYLCSILISHADQRFRPTQTAPDS